MKKLSDLQEFYVWHRYLTIHVKHSYITKSVCVYFKIHIGCHGVATLTEKIFCKMLRANRLRRKFPK